MQEKIITLYSSNDEMEARRLVGILEEKGIEAHLQNAGIQDLFGLGRLGTGYNPLVGTFGIQS